MEYDFGYLVIQMGYESGRSVEKSCNDNIYLFVGYLWSVKSFRGLYFLKFLEPSFLTIVTSLVFCNFCLGLDINYNSLSYLLSYDIFLR